MLAQEVAGALGHAGQPGGLIRAMTKVASIGECMIELRHRGERELDLGFGGDTLNFAVYLARLSRGTGVRVDYVTALGDDPYSDAMLADVAGRGHRLRSGRAPAAAACRACTRSAPMRAASGASPTGARHRPRATCCAARTARASPSELAGYDLLYLSGITLSILDAPQRDALMALADRIRAQGGRVAFDSNFRPAGWSDRDEARAAFDRMLRRVDIALPTLDDDQALFGVADAQACAHRLHGLGVAEVAVKLGAHGCWLSSDGRGRAGAGRAGGARGRQHRRRRQLQCRLPRGAPRRRRA